MLTNIANFCSVWNPICQVLVIHQKTNCSSDKLTLTRFHVDCLSGYLILLCGISTIKGNNGTEKLQNF